MVITAFLVACSRLLYYRCDHLIPALGRIQTTDKKWRNGKVSMATRSREVIGLLLA